MTLLSRFAQTIMNSNDADLLRILHGPELLLAQTGVGSKAVSMAFAPFDHVNPRARLVIVGLTPGQQQAVNALKAARGALRDGLGIAAAAERAKVYASFSGPMRKNLVRMLDAVGVAQWLGVATTAQLWSDRVELAHFTSLLRYPVFVDGRNWAGQPDAVRTEAMRPWIDDYAGHELSQFDGAFVVPLGPKVTEGLRYLCAQGSLDDRRILAGLPHPSGANAERIACFLGDKPPHLASAKTNAAKLVEARELLVAQLGQ